MPQHASVVVAAKRPQIPSTLLKIWISKPIRGGNAIEQKDQFKACRKHRDANHEGSESSFTGSPMLRFVIVEWYLQPHWHRQARRQNSTRQNKGIGEKGETAGNHACRSVRSSGD